MNVVVSSNAAKMLFVNIYIYIFDKCRKEQMSSCQCCCVGERCRILPAFPPLHWNGGQPVHSPSQFFLVLDQPAIPGGLDGVLAFDRLFKKAHNVFSVNCSKVLYNFWEFIDSSIYSVMNPSEAKAKVRDVASAVKMSWSRKHIDPFHHEVAIGCITLTF